MEAWQNDPVAPPQSGGWQSDPVVPAPKMPDTSGVQRMARANLAAPKPDSEETDAAKPEPIQTPAQRLDTAMGMPVAAMLSGGDNTSIPQAIRKHYVDTVQSGGADTFHDFMQTALHAVVPIASRIANPAESAENTAGSVGKVAAAGLEGIGKGYEEGKIFPTPISSNVFSLLGTAANAPFQSMASVFRGFQNVAAQTGIETGLPQAGKEIALLPEELMGTEGINMHLPPEVAPRPTGPWDNLPGHEALRSTVAKVTGKPIEAVTSSDIDQTIAEGAKAKDVPAAKDFQAVATVTGADVNTLHSIYTDTGVKPDQVFEDAQRDPAVAADVANGKVPKAYDHLREPNPEILPDEAERLQVTRDEGARAFNVVDEQGDHVQTGFNSYEEAKQYIDDKKEEPIGREPAEWSERPNIPSSEGLASELKPPAVTEANTIGPELRSASVIPASKIGKPTSLRTFLSNNGAKFNENHELISINRNGEKVSGPEAIEYAHEIAKEQGYLSKNETDRLAVLANELQNLLTERNGGKEAFRDADADRVAKIREAVESRRNLDPAKIEHEAHLAGLDTEIVKGETAKQRTARLLRGLQEFYKDQEGSGTPDILRKAIGESIKTVEKYAGKLSGGLFDKLGEGYIKTFRPELMGDKALRADAYMAKYKAARQEAENSFYSQSAAQKTMWDKKSPDERMDWITDHETGRWNEEDDPDHARFQALLDATFKQEKESIGTDAEKGYRDNYLPMQFEDPEAVKKYFSDENMIKKYGASWFTKKREFNLIQDAIRAGFKLKSDNPEVMLTSRLLAGHNMVATMDLLKDMESSGIAKKATIFGIDKKIAKSEIAIKDLEDKYKAASDKINDPRQMRWDFADPAVSKYMKLIEKRLDTLKTRLDAFNKEKAENTLSPAQMQEIKGGFRVIGPDSKVWNIHPEVAPLWKNAMEMKGLYEREGVIGDAYRAYTAGKAIWTATKLGLSLFHPVHVAMIDLASDIAGAADHLIQGGGFSELATKENLPNLGITKETFKAQDHPAVAAWKTAPEARTPEQQQMVSRMIEGGFKPTMSARDTIHFKENFDKAINGMGVNNLRLLGTAVQLPGKLMAPFFEHWIPGMKSEIYLKRYQDALDRDPSLASDAGRRGEVARQIAKDTDRTYGEMNNDVQFWNRNVRDSFNAAFISGGWKLAQIYNVRGLLQPLKIAHDFLTTGEFNKADITFNMLHAYAYTGLTLATGAAINTILGNPIGTAKDDVWAMVKNLVAPQTGEKNPDGTPIRLNQPAFAKEAYNLAHEINTKGLLAGSGSFLYRQTLMPGIADTLSNQDFTGRELISDPTDLHQWMNAGWDTISPITFSAMEKADAKHSPIGKVAGFLGFPMAGAYINQTPFEQKVIYTYDQQNPPKGDVYSQKLKAELREAIAEKDNKSAEETKQKMKEHGLSDRQISNAEKVYTKPFVESAWKKLSSQDQKRLIESASDEEKAKFIVKQ